MGLFENYASEKSQTQRPHIKYPKQTNQLIWLHTFAISTLRRLRQEDHSKFKNAWVT